MKFYTLLITLILIITGEITLCSEQYSQEILSPFNSGDMKQVQNSGNEEKRSENIKIIDTNLKSQQEIGKLKKDPLILINSTAFTFQEFTSGKDTISILGKGVIKEISVAAGMLENMLRDKFKKPGNTGVLVVTISPKTE